MHKAFTAVLLFASMLLPAAATTADDVAYIDLMPKANRRVTDSDVPGNNRFLPLGEHKFADSMFRIVDGYLQLGSTAYPEAPEKIEGIVVNTSFETLQILHATGYGGSGQEGDAFFVRDGTLIGQYILRYEDKSDAIIPILYGEDVRDWWDWDQMKPVTRGKVGWTGDGDIGAPKIRYYVTTWKNPKPSVKVASIDYFAVGGTVCAPFCLAVTAVREGKPSLADAARMTYEKTLESYRSGQWGVGVEDLYRWSRRWRNATVRAATTGSEKVAAFEMHLNRMAELERLTRTLYDAGRTAPSSVSATQFYRIEAELLLEEQKAK